MAKREATVAIIGGSGLYEMEGLGDVEFVEVDTPFGKPSDAIAVGYLEETSVAFLPRHGRGGTVTKDMQARAAEHSAAPGRPE